MADEENATGGGNASNTPPISVYHYGGAWGLPSMEPLSLEALTYLKLSGAPATLIECCNPNMSPSGQLPLIHVHQGDVFVHDKRCIGFLESRMGNMDEGLSALEKSEVTAFTSVVRGSLERARLFNWWADEDNYLATTRPAYASRMPFPLSHLLPDRMRSALKEKLNASGLSGGEVYAEAAHAYEALAVRLGDEQRFFPGRPYTSLDVCVFAALATHLFAPMPNHRLREELLRHPALVRFTTSLLQEVFAMPEPPFVANCDRAHQSEESEAASWTTLLYSAGAVAGVFALYILSQANAR